MESKKLKITRTFNASQQQVWDAFTNAELLSEWWGPKGAKINVKTFDFKLNGLFLYSMENPDGMKLWAKFVYKEIEEPEKIVFINSFSDENGRIGKNPWLPVWPEEIINYLTLKEENGQTILTLEGHPINASEEEVNAYEGMTDNMQAGFKGTFDKLDELLTK
jgi:uncharacterized protein YndB with AHSA1/START domain